MNSLRSWLQQFHQACTDCGQYLHQVTSTRSLHRVQLFRKRFSRKKGIPESVVLAVAAIALTSALGQAFYNQPQLSVGKITSDTIHAPADAKVIDLEATEEKRRTARTIAAPVFMIDTSSTEQIKQSVQALLAKGAAFRQQAGAFPFVSTDLLSESTQRYLRKAEEWEWRLIVNAAQEQSTIAAPQAFNSPERLGVQLSDPAQRKAADELKRYRNQMSSDGLSGLTTQIAIARQKYLSALGTIQSPTLEATTAFDPTVVDLSDKAWQKMQSEVT